jgi:hypothetical protein
MPIFKKVTDAPEGDLTISTPVGDVVVPASGTVEVSEDVATELRLVPSVEEAAAAAPKTSKESK